MDRRLLGAGLVDAAADDLDRLVDRRLAPRRQGDVAVAQRRLAVGTDRRHEIGIEIAEQFLDLVHPSLPLDLIEIAQREDNLVTLDVEPGVADPVVAQRGAGTVDDVVEALLQRGAEIDLEQKVRAAAQIEAEADLPLGQEAGQRVDRRCGKEVRRGKDHAKRADDQDEGDLPGLKMQHGRAEA